MKIGPWPSQGSLRYRTICVNHCAPVLLLRGTDGRRLASSGRSEVSCPVFSPTMRAAQIEASYVRYRTDKWLPQNENKHVDLGGPTGSEPGQLRVAPDPGAATPNHV